MINITNIEKAKKEIKLSKAKPVIVQAQSDFFNRKIVEYGKFDILLSPERGDRNDSIRQLNSGLNHVLAKIAKNNNIRIGINLTEISKLSKEKKAKRLAKIKQNIQICKKAKTKLTTIPNNKNSFSLLISLGASNQQAKEAIAKL